MELLSTLTRLTASLWKRFASRKIPNLDESCTPSCVAQGGKRGVFRARRFSDTISKWIILYFVVLWEMTRTRFEPDALPLSDAHATDGSRDRTHLNPPDARERSPVSEHDRHVDPPGR